MTQTRKNISPEKRCMKILHILYTFNVIRWKKQFLSMEILRRNKICDKLRFVRIEPIDKLKRKKLQKLTKACQRNAFELLAILHLPRWNKFSVHQFPIYIFKFISFHFCFFVYRIHIHFMYETKREMRNIKRKKILLDIFNGIWLK